MSSSVWSPVSSSPLLDVVVGAGVGAGVGVAATAERTGRPILFVSAAPHCAGVSGIW